MTKPPRRPPHAGLALATFAVTLLTGCTSRVLGVGIDMSPQDPIWSTWQEVGDRHTFRTSDRGVEVELDVRPYMEYPCAVVLRNRSSESVGVLFDLGPAAEQMVGIGKFYIERMESSRAASNGVFDPAIRLQLEPGSTLTVFLTDLPGLSLRSPSVGDLVEFSVEIATEAVTLNVPILFQVEGTHEVRVEHLLIGH